jgi:hypothetical protein
MPTPQIIPLGWSPAGVHVGVPLAQATVILWQEPASVQSAPGEQRTQEPLLHTAPASHSVPSGLMPAGEQVVAPPSQSEIPR